LTFFGNCDLELDPITFINNTNMTRIPQRYTGCANMNFLCQGLWKLSSDRQTDTTKIIYHAALQVVNQSPMLSS